jgi:hypothetical protein
MASDSIENGNSLACSAGDRTTHATDAVLVVVVELRKRRRNGTRRPEPKVERTDLWRPSKSPFRFDFGSGCGGRSPDRFCSRSIADV